MTRLALLAALLLPVGAALAHPLAPGLLQIEQVAPTRHAVLWRTPVVRAGAQTVAPRLPAGCTSVAPPVMQPGSAEVMTTRWLAECPGGLAGQILTVDGLAGSGINVIVRVVNLDGAEQQALLGADAPAVTVQFAGPPVLAHYFALGAEHLAGGLDHVLFLCGLFLLSGAGAGGWARARALLVTATAFTAGHSVTLGATALGYVPLPQAIAETLIAATVLALALELAQPASAHAGMLRRRPVAMAGAFGLVHGLGFAGALRDVGVPPPDLPMALLGFNLGIELAQLALLAALWLLAHVGRALPAPRGAPAVPAYLIGSLAACWLLERSAGLLA